MGEGKGRPGRRGVNPEGVGGSRPRIPAIDTKFVIHEVRDMIAKRRNVTITLDEETARWARVEAARRDLSVSRFVGDLLRESMDSRTAREDARERFFARGPYLTSGPGRDLPSRDELHDRAGLR